MADANRRLTPGEVQMLRSVFGTGINYSLVRVHSERLMWPFPNNRAMAPNGEVYLPGGWYAPDLSARSVPLHKRANFVHEGAHLYQWYGLGWTVWARGPFDRNYDYTIEPGRKYQDYGLEQMGSIAEDYYTLREGGRHARYTLADFAALLPVRA